MKKIIVCLVVAGFTSVSALQAGGNEQKDKAVCEKAPACEKAPTCDKAKSQCPYAKNEDKQAAVKPCCPMAGKSGKTVSSKNWLSYAKQAQR